MTVKTKVLEIKGEYRSVQYDIDAGLVRTVSCICGKMFCPKHRNRVMTGFEHECDCGRLFWIEEDNVILKKRYEPEQ